MISRVSLIDLAFEVRDSSPDERALAEVTRSSTWQAHGGRAMFAPSHSLGGTHLYAVSKNCESDWGNAVRHSTRNDSDYRSADDPHFRRLATTCKGPTPGGSSSGG